MTTRRLLSLFVLLLSAACQRAPYHYQPPAQLTSDAPGVEAAPQLLFLSFNMTTDPAGRHQLASLLVKAVPGQANPIAEEDAPGPSYLLVSQLDARDQPCGPARRVPHPLVQDVETPTATGELKRQLSTLPQAEFFVRLARQPRARVVRLQEVGPAAPNPISATFPLPN